MGKNRKTVFKGFDYMHCDDFARLLMDMAKKGWHFKEWGVGLKFEKGEPENATYAVEVFNKASENDTRPAPETKDFVEYCEAAGWKFIDAKQKFCVFKKIDEDAAELFTPEERVVNCVKATTTGYPIMLLVLYGINALMQWVNVSSFFEMYIFSPTFLFVFSIWNVMFFGQIFTFLHAFWKKRKLLKDIREGKDIYLGSLNKLHLTARDIYVVVLLLILSSYFLIIQQVELLLLNVGMIVSVLLLTVFINKFRPDRDTNVIIQMVYSFVVFVLVIVISIAIISETGENVTEQKEDIPLHISDYRECSYEEDDIDIYHDGNLFGRVDDYFIFAGEDAIYYRIYSSKNSKILDRIWEEELGSRKINEGAVDCTSDWDAQKALRNKLGTYYVRYEDYILIFSDDEHIYLTPEQIDIILKKLDIR